MMKDLNQSTWRVLGRGAGIGLFSGILLVLLAALIGFAFLPSKSYEAMELALILYTFVLYGLPLMLILGSLFGWLFLRQPKPRRQAWLLVGSSTFLATCLVLISGTVIWHSTLESRIVAYQHKQREQRTVRVRVVNFAPHTIANATLWPFNSHTSLKDLDYPPEYPPVATDASIVPGLDSAMAFYGQPIPKWDSQLTMQVSWGRPRQGQNFKHGKDPFGENCYLQDYVELSATVHLPPYQGVKNKVFTVFFLPNDQVCVKALDSQDQGLIHPPVDDSYVVQGRTVHGD